MNHVTSRRGTLLLLAFWCAASAAAQTIAPEAAQSPKPPDEHDQPLELSVFKVSGSGDTGYFSKNTLMGTRTTERLIDIPQSIQIVNRELLTDLAQTDYQDALQYAASGVNSRQKLVGDFNVRGFRVFSQNILRDGMPGGTAANVSGPTYDIERIEIVKGPAALLFGQSAATGGIINFVTKRPTKTPQSSVTAIVGSYDRYQGVAETSGPLGNTGLSYRATVEVTDAKGPRRFDSIKDRYYSVSLDQKISPTATLSLDAYSYYEAQTLSQLAADNTGHLIKVADDFSFFEPWVDHPHWYSFASATLQAAITPTLQMQIVANGTWGRFHRKRVFARGTADAVTGVLNRTFQDFNQNNRNENLLADFIKTFETGTVQHKTSLGFWITPQRNTQDLDSVLIAPINIYNPVYNTPYPTYTPGVQVPGSPAPNKNISFARQESAYLQHQLTLWKGKVILVGGYRYNVFHSTTTNYLPTTSVTTLDRNAGVKRWGVIYKPTGAFSIYYNYSEAFVYNSGTFIGGPRDGQQLLPSYGIDKELGVKVETPNGRVFGSAALFDMSFTNVRTVYTQPSGVSGVSQDGLQTNKGGEFDLGLNFELPPGQLQMILTYYKGDLKDQNGALPTTATNDMWSAYAAQSFSHGAVKGLRVAFGAMHKGDVPLGNAGTIPFVQPAYTTTTVMVALDRDRYRIALNLDNLFGKRFFEGGGDSTWIHVNPGLTWKVTTSYRF